MDVLHLVLLPTGLGLLGFIEPCTLGSSLLFIQYLGPASVPEKIAQVLVFTATRALVIGSLGALAAVIGGAFVGFQKAAWLLLGAVYVAVGVLYLVGQSGTILRRIGPKFKHLAGVRGSAALAVLFGLNIPACAAPLLAAALGATVAGGTAGLASVATGFVSLALFGLALSLPLVLAVLWPVARRGLEHVTTWGAKIPRVTGLVFVVLGAWSIHFGIAVDPRS